VGRGCGVVIWWTRLEALAFYPIGYSMVLRRRNGGRVPIGIIQYWDAAASLQHSVLFF